jgi:beta-phosphoglucomutase
MKHKDKLALFDLDGTLFNTTDVNYYAYKEAMEQFGYTIEYKYFQEYCNGRHYSEFLPQITTKNKEILAQMHYLKKCVYYKYLDKAKPNKRLFELIESINKEYYICVVTTASRQNTEEILKKFNVLNSFDLLVTQEDISKSKPDPEGFFVAMKYFNISPQKTIIFEDSKVGVEAAEMSGAGVFVAKGFN